MASCKELIASLERRVTALESVPKFDLHDPETANRIKRGIEAIRRSPAAMSNERIRKAIANMADQD